MERPLDQPTGPATLDQADAFAERVAICMVDGGLSEEAARKLAEWELEFERSGGRF